MTNPRTAHMLGPDGARGTGLEIGALHAPTILKSEHDVLYVDYATTEVVKANQFDPSVNPDDIVDVDIVWGDRPLREAAGRTVDFVVASHVIEHVPDLVGWLHELREVLRDGGTLGLTIPDKRFTFDALRNDSTLADVIEAYVLGYRTPSLRQIYDVASLGVGIDAAEVWSGQVDLDAKRGETLKRLKPALALVRDLHARPRYNDAHCWVFTPLSFVDLVAQLAELELFPFRIEHFHPTDAGWAEFYVRLIAIKPDERAASLASIASAREAALKAASPPRPLDPEVLRAVEDARRLGDENPAIREALHASLGAVKALESANGVLRDGLESARATAAAQAAETAALSGALEAMRASTSWRATALLRALARLAGRGA